MDWEGGVYQPNHKEVKEQGSPWKRQEMKIPGKLPLERKGEIFIKRQ